MNDSIASAYTTKVYDAVNAGLMAYLGPPPRRILDVGCGNGATIAQLRALGYDALGITLSPAEAEVAQSQGLDVRLADGTGALPFEPHSFDHIYMSHVLEHMPDSVGALRGLAQYLKPDGSFLIAVPNIAHHRPRRQLAMGRFPQEDYGVFDRTHLRWFTFWKPAEVAAEAGLEVVHHKGSGAFPLGPFRRLLPKRAALALDRFGLKIAPNLTAYEVFVVARPKP